VDDVSQDVSLVSPQVVVIAFVFLDCISPGLSSFLDVVCEGGSCCSCVVGEALEGEGEEGELPYLLGCRERVELVFFSQEFLCPEVGMFLHSREVDFFFTVREPSISLTVKMGALFERLVMVMRRRRMQVGISMSVSVR
jgi:hypothetical protein